MIRIEGRTERTGPRVVVLGTFDGVHLGHRELIRQGKIQAKRLGVPLRVCTFDRHPLEVIYPDRSPQLLNTAEEKRERMEEYGAEELRVWHFDRRMAMLPPEKFLELLRQECDLRVVVAGWNYTFGKGGAGNGELLRREGLEQGWETVIVPPVTTAAGDVISSSAIRRELLSGNLEEAREMLGYDYPVSGIGMTEAAAGEEGFLRIRTESGKLLPGPGLYTGELLLPESGKALPALVRSEGKQGALLLGLRVPPEAEPKGRPVRLRLRGTLREAETPDLPRAPEAGGEHARRAFEAREALLRGAGEKEAKSDRFPEP